MGAQMNEDRQGVFRLKLNRDADDEQAFIVPGVKHGDWVEIMSERTGARMAAIVAGPDRMRLGTGASLEGDEDTVLVRWYRPEKIDGALLV